MEFSFDIQKYFKTPTVKITNSIIPADFNGDKRDLNLYYQHMYEIIDKMGIASAVAQGLQKPITSAIKLQNSDHILYFMTDTHAGSRGVVIGLLKMGFKNLYLFDTVGRCIQNKALCVLDFYVHESMQRMGCGLTLFEYMLRDMNVKVHQLAIDKPSPKFLSFLNKHYGLNQIIPQNNHFVVFRQYFNDKNDDNNKKTEQSPPWLCKDTSSATSLHNPPHKHIHTQLW